MNWTRIESGKYVSSPVGNTHFAIVRRDPRLWELDKIVAGRFTRTQHSTLRQAQAHAAKLAGPQWVCTWQSGPDSTWEYQGEGFYASASSWQEEYNGPMKFGYSLYRVQPGNNNADWVTPNYLGGKTVSSLVEAKTIAARGPQN